MKLLVKTFLLFFVLFFIVSCSKEGEGFVGKWKHIMNPKTQIEIVSNGDNFIVIENGKEYPATYTKGNLEIRTNQAGFEIVQINYVVKDDKVIVNSLFGPQEYVRMHEDIESTEIDKSEYIPSQELKINNDWVISVWSDIASMYHRRNLICSELLILSNKSSVYLDSLIAIANDSSKYDYYDKIIINESLFTSYLALQSKIGIEFSKILVSIDPYVNKSIKEAISRLEHTENQIAKSRMKYNTAVKKYNLLVDKESADFIKSNPIYTKKFLIEAKSASEVVPRVEY